MSISAVSRLIGLTAVRLQDERDRMPVILDPAQYGQWLDPGAGVQGLRAQHSPFRAEEMTALPVSAYVSNAKNQRAECLQPASSLPGIGDWIRVRAR